MSEDAPKKPKFNKRDAQLAEDWQEIANTAAGRRIIADLMTYANVYTPIEDTDPIRLALANGERNLAMRVVFLLNWRAETHKFAERADEDTDLLNRMLMARH